MRVQYGLLMLFRFHIKDSKSYRIIMKGLRIIVLAKQVPDTRNVGKEAMKAYGTVNSAVLHAIFNPEDLNALELALRVKDEIPGTTVTILTMGPGRAAEIIREGLYLSLIHISEPTRRTPISYAVFCLKKKK